MVEKIGTVKNPLSIIAIFAAISEVFGTIVLPFIDEKNQMIFIIFLISFPSILVFLFFITLNLNNKVLYAPSDYKNEDNFVTIQQYDLSKQKEVIKKVKNNTAKSNSQYLQEIRNLNLRLTTIEELLNSKPVIDNNIVISQSEIEASIKKNVSISISNFDDANELVKTYDNLGYSTEIYRIEESGISSHHEHKAIWLGSRVSLKFAIEVIKIAKEKYDFLEYIDLSDDNAPDYVHDQIFIGGSTETAKKYKLKPLKQIDFKHLEEIPTKNELHKFISIFN